MEQAYYWIIEKWDGEQIRVTPDPQKIAYIQQMIEKGTGSIKTPTRSIVIKDIKDFRVGDEMYFDRELLEAGSQAFHDPLYSEDGSIQVKWVKKSVPRRKWDSYYSKISSYKLLQDGDSYVYIAFRVATHDIDRNMVSECSQEEQIRLGRLITVK